MHGITAFVATFIGGFLFGSTFGVRVEHLCMIDSTVAACVSISNRSSWVSIASGRLIADSIDRVVYDVVEPLLYCCHRACNGQHDIVKTKHCIKSVRLVTKYVNLLSNIRDGFDNNVFVFVRYLNELTIRLTTK